MRRLVSKQVACALEVESLRVGQRCNTIGCQARLRSSRQEAACQLRCARHEQCELQGDGAQFDGPLQGLSEFSDKLRNGCRLSA